MNKKMYAYGRVSTKEQNLDRQFIAFREQGVPSENYFVDKQSGKNFDRPAYQEMLGILSPGDTLVINIKTRYLILSEGVGIAFLSDVSRSLKIGKSATRNVFRCKV